MRRYGSLIKINLSDVNMLRWLTSQQTNVTVGTSQKMKYFYKESSCNNAKDTCARFLSREGGGGLNWKKLLVSIFIK